MPGLLRESDYLEKIIDNWKFMCPDRECANKTFTIESDSNFHFMREESDCDTQIRVRLISCQKCHKSLVITTKSYFGKNGEEVDEPIFLDDRAMSERVTAITPTGNIIEPIRTAHKEYIISISPFVHSNLTLGLSKKIVETVNETEKALQNDMRLSAAAMIRSTVRLIVEDLTDSNPDDDLKLAIQSLPFKKEYIDALIDLKVIGDKSLHDDGYSLKDIDIAYRVLLLAMRQYYEEKQSLTELKKNMIVAANRRAQQERRDKKSKYKSHEQTSRK